jgi:AraC-like DNA-binding protein
MRQRRPDGSVWVRTYPATFATNRLIAKHSHDWDQLTYAADGVMRVHTDAASFLVPPHRAVVVPAGLQHAEEMLGPVSVRTLYLAPGLAKALQPRCRTVNVSRLLRELILHVSRIGALDRKVARQARLIGVLLDEIEGVTEVPLQLPMPSDPRALRFAEILRSRPDDGASIALLARRAGASRRTIERLLLSETRMTAGEWRRRLRLLHAVRRLAEGESVTNASLDAGYASTSAFIAAFKRALGTTPGRYSRLD